jgi:orotidine-5'-phosphate decarboxylase
MIPAHKVMVALDTQDLSYANKILTDLAGSEVWIKIGMEAYYRFGNEIIYRTHDKGFKIFLDLKLHDIPNTVVSAIKTLTKLPISMLNLHAAGGGEMMKRAHEEIKNSSPPPLLVAVTQLTSTTEGQMRNEQQIQLPLEQSVLHYANLAKESGLNGVVCSALEVEMIKKECGRDFITVTPGIRPQGFKSDDQKRIVTPSEANRLGVDFMVIGRPITAALEPKLALKNILEGYK